MKFFRWLSGKLDMNDLAALAGVGLVGWGVWQIYEPAAYILIGAGLVWWGYTGGKSSRRSK